MDFQLCQSSIIQDGADRQYSCLYRKTRANLVRKRVREIYLRNDIPCGIMSCTYCNHDIQPPRLEVSQPILVLDVSACLSQMDFIASDDSIDNVFIPVTVMNHLREKYMEGYARLRTLCRSLEDSDSYVPIVKGHDVKVNVNGRRFFVFSNEFSRDTYISVLSGETPAKRHARAILHTANWLQRHSTNENMCSQVIFLTEDRQQRLEAAKLGLNAMSCAKYVRDVASKIHKDAGEKLSNREVIADDEDESYAASHAMNLNSDANDEDDIMDNDEGEKTLQSNDLKTKVISKASSAIYAAHWSEKKIKTHMEDTKTVLKGRIDMSMGSCFSAVVRCSARDNRCLAFDVDVLVKGRDCINRSLNGDIVAVELLSIGSAGLSSMSSAAVADVFDAGEAGVAVLIHEGADEPEAKAEQDAANLEAEEISGDKAVKRDSPSVEEASAQLYILSSANGTVSTEDIRQNEKVFGRVVAIMKREPKEVAGTLRPLMQARTIATEGSGIDTEVRVFVPQDARLPNVRIRTRQATQLENKRILVRIDSWARDEFTPSGHWTAIMGDAGDPRVEGDVILHNFGVITREFGDSILRCLPPADFKPDEAEIAKRMDLRHLLTCSVDPPGCKDIDDALTCQDLGNGRYLLGVHIADVTHFVKPETPIDVEAAERCTTVYLVDRRTDMLPGLLTTDLCSLVGGTERLTFSVLWEIDDQGNELKPPVFGKAIIKSRAALTYAQAQSMIDDEADKSDLAIALKNMMRVSLNIRKKRISGGALELASTEVKLELENESMDPVDVTVYVFKDTNKMVEEMMLFANRAVAKKITESFPLYSVLRRHPPPKLDELKKLKDLLEEHGVKDFSFSNSKELSDSLNTAVRDSDPFFNKLVRILTTRCMNQAKYFCTGDVAGANEYRHYGLATDYYTHFTSPIRRYADVLVHRLLQAALGKSSLPEMLSSKERVVDQCDLMNKKHHNAQWAGRASVDFFVCRYFLKHGSKIESAVILRVKANGLHVTLPKFGVDGIVLMDAETHVYDEKTAALRARDGSYALNVFDRVMVKVEATDKDYRYRTILSFLNIDNSTKKVDDKFMEAERKRIADEMFPDRVVKEVN